MRSFFFGPAVLAGLVGVASQNPHLPEIRGLAIGIGLIAVLAVGVPIVSDRSTPPVVADLGGGRWPGPRIFDTAIEWGDRSWDTRVQQIGTPRGPDGPRSLCLTLQASHGAFYAHHPHCTTNDYQTLSFDLGPAGHTVPLVLSVRDTAGQTVGSVPLAPWVNQAQVHDGWRTIQVPLSDLHTTARILTDILLQTTTPVPTPTVGLQRLAFH